MVEAGRDRDAHNEPLAQELAAHKLRTEGSNEALVFGRTATEPFNPESIRRNALAAWGWQEVPNKEADGPRTILAKKRDDAQQPITLHEARHTCASLLIAAGVNAKALSVIMGHATIATTFDTYGHMMPGGLDEAAAAANAYLAGDGQRPGAQARGVKARANLGPVVY